MNTSYKNAKYIDTKLTIKLRSKFPNNVIKFYYNVTPNTFIPMTGITVDGQPIGKFWNLNVNDYALENEITQEILQYLTLNKNLNHDKVRKDIQSNSIS